MKGHAETHHLIQQKHILILYPSVSRIVSAVYHNLVALHSICRTNSDFILISKGLKLQSKYEVSESFVTDTHSWQGYITSKNRVFG